MNWQPVSSTDNEIVERSAQEGGWIYRIRTRGGSEHTGFTWSVAFCFVTPAPAAP